MVTVMLNHHINTQDTTKYKVQLNVYLNLELEMFSIVEGGEISEKRIFH